MNRPVRVLWLAKGLGPGGAERLLVALARTIDPGRFHIRAAYLLPEKRHLVAELAEAGVEATCLDAPGADPRWVRKLHRLVADYRPDVVHVHAPQPAAAARPMVRLMRRRPALLYTEHNTWDGYVWPTRLANAATYPLDDYRLAVSQTAMDSVPRPLRRRMEVLVHGVDLDEVRGHASARERMRAELGISPDEVLVVTVANLRAHKDYPTLLAAARQMVDSGGRVRFAAVGQGPLESDIRRRVEQLHLGDAFRLLGYRPDSLDVLAAADVFCLTSVAEGLPVALMEALALGKPVVSTGVGGIPEAVRDGVEGRLVPAATPSAVADAIRTLAADSDLRARMAAASLDRSGLFDIRRAASRHEELYQSYAGRRSET